MTKIRRIEPRAGHHWSDYAGFVIFASMTIYLAIINRAFLVVLFPTILHEFLTAIMFLARRGPKAEATGFLTKVSAYVATAIIPVSLAVLRYVSPESLVTVTSRSVGIVAYFVWLAGAMLGIMSLWDLRTSFSIIPQARELRTRGRYAMARHPMYAGYALQYLAIAVMKPHLAIFLVVATWFVVVLVRIHHEENVLAHVFPQYAAYRVRVGMFGPKLFRWRRTRPPVTIAEPELVGASYRGKLRA